MQPENVYAYVQEILEAISEQYENYEEHAVFEFAASVNQFIAMATAQLLSQQFGFQDTLALADKTVCILEQADGNSDLDVARAITELVSEFPRE